MTSSPPTHAQPHLTVLLAELGNGGVGKMRLHLVNALVRQGYRVDLVLGHAGVRRPHGLDRPEPMFEANTRARAVILRYSAPFGDWTVTGHAGVQDFTPDDLPENNPASATAGFGFERRF